MSVVDSIPTNFEKLIVTQPAKKSLRVIGPLPSVQYKNTQSLQPVTTFAVNLSYRDC